MTDALGIDIGRVIVAAVAPDGTEDTSFIGRTDEDAVLTPPAAGAPDTIGSLSRRFGGRVWLVSKCGSRMEQKTRLWLARQRFFETTGVPAGNLRFCRERREKAAIARELGLTHFIDDRVDVLEPMRGVVPHLLAFGAQERDVPRWAVHVADWAAVAAWFERTDAGAAAARPDAPGA